MNCSQPNFHSRQISLSAVQFFFLFWKWEGTVKERPINYPKQIHESYLRKEQLADSIKNMNAITSLFDKDWLYFRKEELPFAILWPTSAAVKGGSLQGLKIVFNWGCLLYSAFVSFNWMGHLSDNEFHLNWIEWAFSHIYEPLRSGSLMLAWLANTSSHR